MLKPLQAWGRHNTSNEQRKLKIDTGPGERLRCLLPFAYEQLSLSPKASSRAVLLCQSMEPSSE